MHARPTPTAVLARPAVRLRNDRAQVIAVQAGITTLAGMAEFYGATQSNFTRVWNGLVNPGERFIANALAKQPQLKFDDLFEVVQDEAA